MSLSGVVFRPISFTPADFKFKDELCHGVFMDVVDRKVFNSIKCVFAVLYTLMEVYPEKFELNHMMDLLTGDDFMAKKKSTLEEVLKKLDNDSIEFEKHIESVINMKKLMLKIKQISLITVSALLIPHSTVFTGSVPICTPRLCTIKNLAVTTT